MASNERPKRLVAYTDATGFGGAEVQLGDLLAGMSDRHDVTLMAVSETAASRIASRCPSVKVRIVPAVRGKWDVGGMITTARAMRACRPDLVITNHRHPYSSQYGLAVAAGLPGTKVVAVHHLPLATGSRIQRWLVGVVMRRADAVVAVGGASARELEALLSLEPGSVRVIHNGVPEIVLSPPPRPFAEPIIGSIGRLVEQKGYDRLISVLPRLPGTAVVIVGDGPDRAALLSLALEMNVESRVAIVGSPEEPRDWLGSFDAFVLPSRYESFPLSILQAMQAGVAVVASNVGSISEAVVDGDTGFIVDPSDSDALVSAIQRALGPDGIMVAKRARPAALERFSVEAMVDRYDELIGQLLAEPGSAH